MLYILFLLISSLVGAETLICDQVVQTYIHPSSNTEVIMSCSTCFDADSQLRLIPDENATVQLDYTWQGSGYSYSGQKVSANMIDTNPCYTVTTEGRMNTSDVLYASLAFWNEINPHSAL